MPVLLPYMIKASIGLAAVYLFYQVFLRRLTFHQWNRWYLLLYALLSLFLPLMNIYWWMDPPQESDILIRYVPSIRLYADTSAGGMSAKDLLAGLALAGMALMLGRLAMQYLSYRRLRKTARLLVKEDVKLYQVEQRIIPFSFGNAVYINPAIHDPEELKEIIRHEMVHVRQKHTVDMVFAELLVAFNWYNPFAWLIRHAIRQNLEFVADKAVLSHGVDRKTYQYLLLKVIGQKQFSLGTHLNFSALKNRINMMNRLQSAKLHLLKFSFAIPLLAVLLLAFRKEQIDTHKEQAVAQQERVMQAGQAVALPAIEAASPAAETTLRLVIPADTLPAPAAAQAGINRKGYIISIADNAGECIVIIKNKKHQLVKAIELTEWNKAEAMYRTQYGDIPPLPPPLPEALAAPAPELSVDVAPDPAALAAPVPPAALPAPAPPAVAPPSLPPAVAYSVKWMQINDRQVRLETNKGKIEQYNLNIPAEKAAFEKKYPGTYSELPAGPKKSYRVDVETGPAPRQSSSADTKSGQAGVVTVPRGTPGEAASTELSFVHNNDTLHFQPYEPSVATVDRVPSSQPAPLLIVDGEEKNMDELKKIPPANIESVNVLKDKYAVDKYGNKGKNGVIEVKTKK